MALYQDIMNVPGLTGTWQDRLKQYYKNLTGKTYQGTRDEGLYMLKQISAKNYGSSSSTAKKTDPVADMAKSITSQVKPQGKTFEELYGTSDKFIGEQKPLIEQGIAQQTQSQFLPQIDEGIQNIRKAFAERGLFRSGIRGKEETGFLGDIADEEAKVRQQLYSTRENELGNRYSKMQQDYETALKQGTQYKAPTELTSYAVTSNPAFQPTGQMAGSRYSPLSAYEGTDSNSRFGAAYKDWYENRFKKTRPDVSYNY